MNGFVLMADSYRKAAGEGKINADEAEKQARIYDFLGTCDTDDFYTLVDSSAFNEIIKDYVRLALNKAGVDDETRSDVMNELRFLFSEKRAKEVCEG